MKKIVFTNNAPKAIGAYSQAIETEDFVFCSGQIPLKANNSLVDEDIAKQTNQVIDNLEQILKSIGLNLSNIVKTTIYLVNISDFQVVNEVYKNRFNKNHPSRAVVQVAALPKKAKIEMEAIASKKI